MLVGIDPGAGSPVTAVLRFSHVGEAVFGLSNKEYRHECRFTKHGIWMDGKQRELNLKDWMSRTPSSKVHTVQEFEYYLQHLYWGDFLKIQFELQMLHKTKGNRLESYIYKQRTLATVAKRIIEAKPEEGPEPKNVFIAFGDASWTRVKGHASAPRGKQFMKALQQYAKQIKKKKGCRKVYVLKTPEYNTSQVCSACEGNGEHFKMLEPLASQKIKNPHYVRKCQLCQTVWDRDVNAARNILRVGLSIMQERKKPDIFCHRLPDERPEGMQVTSSKRRSTTTIKKNWNH